MLRSRVGSEMCIRDSSKVLPGRVAVAATFPGYLTGRRLVAQDQFARGLAVDPRVCSAADGYPVIPGGFDAGPALAVDVPVFGVVIGVVQVRQVALADVRLFR